ncbi:MAG: diacylglycerol kinase [Steroidobacteraceae bacterium]
MRIFKAMRASAKGLAAAIRYEASFRSELLLALVVLPAGLWFGNSPLEKLALTAPMLLVLIIELVNSAIEAAIDRVGIEVHELSGRAKDLGSAAVFFSLLLLALSWLLILGTRWALF